MGFLWVAHGLAKTGFSLELIVYGFYGLQIWVFMGILWVFTGCVWVFMGFYGSVFARSTKKLSKSI